MISSYFSPPRPLPRFAASEYLDAAFLTKLMCIGKELHDFLTLPAQVGAAALLSWVLVAGVCVGRASLGRTWHACWVGAASPFSPSLPSALLACLLPNPTRTATHAQHLYFSLILQDIIIAMGM